MNLLTTRQLLARLGLEPRRATSTRVALVSSMLGLGAALGAGAVLLSRLEPLRARLRMRTAVSSAPGEVAPTRLQTA